MKFNSTLCIYIFFSALIAIKAQVNSDPLLSEHNDQMSIDTKDQRLGHKTSKRLQATEGKLSEDKKKFVEAGQVKETLVSTYRDSMGSDAAKDGLAKVNLQWRQMIEGPETARLMEAFGENFTKVVSSAEGMDFINTVVAAVHVMLTRAGGESGGSGLGDILSLTFNLLMSPNMPEIVDKTGELIVTAINKPRAARFARRYWSEVRDLLAEDGINRKINTSFNNVMSLMKVFHGQTAAPSSRRTR